MANKINIRLILELTEKGTSGRTIAALHHISHHSITAVQKRAAELEIKSADITELKALFQRLCKPSKWCRM